MKKNTRKRAIWCIEEDLHFFTNILRADGNVTKACDQTTIELPKTHSHCQKRYHKLKTHMQSYYLMLTEQAKMQLAKGIDIDPVLILAIKERFPTLSTRAELLSKIKPATVKRPSKIGGTRLLTGSQPTTTAMVHAVQPIQVVDIIPTHPPLTISAKLLSKIDDLEIDHNGDIRLHLKAFQQKQP